MSAEPQPIARLPGPLDGLVVIDLTRVLSGPYCTMLLGDMGARVIKIEQPGRGDDTRAWGPPFVGRESAYFLSINRNKESVTLDFGHPRGRAILEALLERADVLVENFRPGTLDRKQLGYADLSPRFPKLIYCSISGFGQTGPRRARPGYDAVVQAEGGLMSITGDADGPAYRLGVAIADIVAGMYAAQGVAMALLARARTGRGQHVDLGMIDAVTSLLTYQAGIYFATGRAPARMGNRHPTIVPYETFEAADGEFVLAVGNDQLWTRFCEVAGLPDLAADARFTTNQGRVTEYDRLRPRLAAVFRTATREQWLRRLEDAGIPCGAVRSVADVLEDPHAAARAMIEQVDHASAGRISVLGVPVKLSETPGSVRLPPPRLGEHTDTVLGGDLGMSREEIEELRRERTV
jgi:crotonobetainyl-CoA:carnitine CoA-transferase CaiB-like acyl-CoA transferase